MTEEEHPWSVAPGTARTAAEGGDATDLGEPAGLDESAEGGDDHRGSFLSFLRELPVLLLVAFLLAFLLRTFVVQVFFIPSESMTPTLEVNDRIIVEKITYRFREPRRGEIVVFESDARETPDDASTVGQIVRGVGQFLGIVPANARDFVKRVIGLPGDEILIEDGTVIVNGEPIDEPYVINEDRSDQGPFVVPEGQLFFLGDNRPNSADSRSSLGYVALDQVVGRAVLILWPPDRAQGIGGADLDVPSPRGPGEPADVGADGSAAGQRMRPAA